MEVQLARLLGSFDGVQRNWLPCDVVAGPTVGAVLVAELAYATIAGVTPVVMLPPTSGVI